jgi:hypothetical protein
VLSSQSTDTSPGPALQAASRVDPNNLHLIIDGWSKTFDGSHVMALLARSKPDEDGKQRDWLLALNQHLDSGRAEDIQKWLKKELKAVNLRISNVKTVSGDNASVNTALCTIMKAQHIPCAAHTLNLVMEDAWAMLCIQWPDKVAKIISNYNKSDLMAKLLKQHQMTSGQPVHGLLAWNDTRWTGKAVALERFIRVTTDHTVRSIVHYDLTDSERQSIEDLLPLLQHMATLNRALTLESHGKPMAGPCHFGSHYRLIQHAYVAAILQGC